MWLTNSPRRAPAAIGAAGADADWEAAAATPTDEPAGWVGRVGVPAGVLVTDARAGCACPVPALATWGTPHAAANVTEISASQCAHLTGIQSIFLTSCTCPHPYG